MSTRIGPRMEDAMDYVKMHPGTAMLPVALAVGPHGSAKFGYRTVHRAIKAGLIGGYRNKAGVYRLYSPGMADMLNLPPGARWV